MTSLAGLKGNPPSSSGDASSLIAVEAQLVSVAQRHLQVRFGSLYCRRGDGWALFSFDALDNPEEVAQLGKEVQRLCNALVRDVTNNSGQIRIRLAGENEEANFADINDGAESLAKLMAQSGDVTGAGDLLALEEKTKANGEASSTPPKHKTSPGDAALRGMLEMLYTDVASDAGEGVHGVTDFPAVMCPVGKRFDVIMKQSVCIKMYSHCTLEDNEVIGRSAATEGLSPSSAHLNGNRADSTNRNSDDDEGGEEEEEEGHSPGAPGKGQSASIVMEGSFLQNSYSTLAPPKDKPLAKLFIDTASIAHALSFYSSIAIEKELPSVWRAKAFTLPEAGEVLKQVHGSLRRYWSRQIRAQGGGGGGATERMKINAISLLAIVSGDLREYCKNQVVLVGAGWRGPWRMPVEDLRATLDLFKQWSRITALLTREGEWADWDGGSFHDESFDRLAGRLRDAVRVRETIAEAQNLSKDGRLPDALAPEIIFDRCSIFDDAARATWARRVAAFDKEMSFLEPQLRSRVKAVLTTSPGTDTQVRLTIANRTLLRREGIRSAVQSELNTIAEYLVRQVDLAKARLENGNRRAVTSLQRLRITKGCQAECAFIPTLANMAFGASPQLDSVTAHAQSALKELDEQERAVVSEWKKATEVASQKIAELPDAVVIQRPATGSGDDDASGGYGPLSCIVHPSIRQFLMDVHNVRAWAAPASSPSAFGGDREAASASAARYRLSVSAENTIKACEGLVAAAARTQQSVANFNTVLHQTIPCTRAMLRPTIARATQQLMYADSDKRVISLANHQELEGLNLRFQNVVESLSSENRHIRRFHYEFISQVLALHSLDLTRHMDQWRSAVDGMRSAFEEFLSQHHFDNHDDWRRHWDCQIYKALEYQYRKGLESLHENMEEFRVELVFKQGVVQFKPSFEAIREAYYVKLREFVSVPLRFRGLQAKRADSSESYEIYPEMPARNRDRIVTVHTKAVELFQKLNRVRKAFRTHISVGLCGTNGAPDLDSVVAKWADASAAAAAAEAKAKESKKSSKKGNSATAAATAAGEGTNCFSDGLTVVKDHVFKLNKIDDVMKLDCFAISTVPVKATIEEQLHRLEESLLNCMRQNIQTELNEIDAFVFSASNVVERQPTTMDEVGLANKAHRECAAQLKSYEQRLRNVEAQNKDLRVQSGASIELGATKTRWEHLKEAMASHTKVMEASVAKMRVSLDGLIQKFFKDVQRFSHNWKKQKTQLMQAFTGEKTEHIARVLDGLKDQVNDMEDLKTQSKELEAKCDYFSQPKPSFSLLSETVRDVECTSSMWGLYDKFQEELASLRKEDWLTFRSHTYQFEDFCKQWSDALDKHAAAEEEKEKEKGEDKKKKPGSGDESSSSSTNAIAAYLTKLLRNWSVLGPVLKVVRGDGWMTEHWNELFRLLDIPKGMTSTDLTFGNVLDAYQRLVEKEPELKQLQARAQGEIQIREALQDLRTWALEATFTLVSPSAPSATGETNAGSSSNSTAPKVKLITEWKEVMTEVSDNQALLNSLKDTPYYANFADEAAGWEVKLASLAESLLLLNSIQRRWTYLEPIFARGALPQEQARFKRIDKEFTGILREVEADPRVMSLASSADVNDKLKGILEQMERCQQSLMEYLEAKRDKLPRFYFISDEDLLEILGHSQTPSVIQAHLKKLFMGIHSVSFNADETAITHMESADRERVQLLREVSITDKDVEDWLIRLGDAMKATLQELLVKCVQEADQTALACIRAYPSQVLQVALQIRFAADVEAAIASNTLNKVLAQERARLESLTRTDSAAKPDGGGAGEDANVVMLKTKALILDVIHNIEVVELLLAQGVRRVDEWHWQKQLRYTMDGATGLCRVHMTDTSFDYTYEYQGNAPKLVHTPLTDKCYLVLTKGMDLGYGGNPYGPAGTGKTESVKALGSAMGRQVLVFNCDEGIDFQAMGRIFVGIVKCGAWGCFDEFNRLKIDQLSAISQMIQVIQEALKNREPSCPLLNKEVDVNPNAGIFVTLNPAGKGYGGRTKLPDNLKQLFREVAMSVPDNALITSTMLLSEGFAHARVLAKNVVELYRLCGQLMSHQQHYDWGLRPLKAVLQLGGTLIQRWRREHDGRSPSEQDETELILQSLNINTLSKLTFDDARLFSGLLKDIFPGALSREVTYAELEAAVKTAVHALNLQPIGSQTRKVLQLYESMNQRMGVVLVGPSGSGKSTLIRILKKALEVMGVAVPLHVMNPKAMPRRQLLGYMDPDTREWYDGVLTAAARDAVKQPAESRPWVLCDGDIDPEWVESLNSVLDDNKLLTMPNGVRIQFGSNVNFLFETHSLQYASPATVSRMGVIFFSEKDVHLEAVVESLLVRQQSDSRRGSFVSGSGSFGPAPPPPTESTAATTTRGPPSLDKGAAMSLDEKEQKQLLQRILKYVFAAIDEVTRWPGALSVPTTRMGLLKTCLNHVTETQSEADFIYALVRGLGSTLEPSAHQKLAKHLYEMSGQKPLSDSRPLDTYWDRAKNRPAELSADLSASVTPADLLAGRAPVIRTVEIQRLEATLAPLIRGAACTPFFLVGPEGVGKGAAIKHCLSRTGAEGRGGGGATGLNTGIRTATINCSAQTNSVQVMQKLEQLCTPYNTATGRVLRPKEGDRLVLILKNVNLPKPDKYGTVELHSFLQQLILYRGYYNKELEWIAVDRVQLVATMNPNASAGRYAVAPRLLAVVNIITVGNPARHSLLQIYGTYWAALLKSTGIGQGRDFDNGAELSQFVVNVFDKIRRRFEGEEYAHFLFCPRHLTSWITNVLLYKFDAQTTLPAVLAYEANRVFADCLPKPEDRARAEKIFAEQLATIGYSAPSKEDRYATMFVTWFSGGGGGAGGGGKGSGGGEKREEGEGEGAVAALGTSAGGGGGALPLSLASRRCLEQRKYKDVVQEVENALLRYSREFKTLSIPLIPSVIFWVTCVDRVLSKSAGHLIVVGRPGVGRRDAVVLAAYMQRMELVSLNMGQDYGLKNFKNDLRGIIQRAVQQDDRLVLVLEEHNVVQESFLELVNSLVSGGEAPGLFTAEEMELMYSPLREEAANEGFIGPIQAFYLERLQRNLHIALVMDNRHPLFIVRLQSNPGLLGRCELLWMGAWSNEVTKTMCKTLLKDKIAALESDKAYKGFHLHREMLALHESVPDATPKDFEVFMKTYSNMVDAKSKTSGEDIERLETGLAKLREAEEKVENIKNDVNKKRNDVKAMQQEADSALDKIQKNMQDSQEQRDQASELQARLKEEHDDILVKRQKSEEELSGIKPLLEAARDAVSGIRSEQLNEIRSLKSPPEPIRDVLEGVLALLGVNDVSWNSMRAFLGERGAKERILDFDVKNVTPAIRNSVAKLLSQKGQSFKPEVIRRASLAAAPMAEWVKAMIEYATIMERIAPLTRQLEQLERNQKEGEDRLDELKKKLKRIDKLVESLREEFSGKCREAEKLRATLDKAEKDLTKATELLDKLSGEKTRWARDAAAIRQANQLMPLRALLSSAFMTYLPKSTEDVRQRFMAQWTSRLVPFMPAGVEGKEGKATAAAAMRLVGFLRTEAELLQYKAEGLPADELSQENAMVMLDTIQTPLVIDPANQAVGWVKTHLRNQNVVVEVASLHDERFTHTLELAIRFGKTLLVTEVGAVDPILFPVLRKDLISAGAKRVVQVGAKAVDWQDTFRIMLFTRSTDLVLPPSAASLVTEVNFSVTSLGLESQLLGITIQHEKPELEAQKVELLKKEEGLKLELTKLESQLLKELAESHGNLMENTELVASLNTVKTQAASIHEALAKSHALQTELDNKRDVYRPFARTSAKLFFLVKDFERLNRMYQFGLNDFIDMFSTTLSQHGRRAASAAAGPAGQDPGDSDAKAIAATVEALVKRFVQVVFHSVSVGLLKNSRVVFGLHLLHGYLPAGTFPQDQWEALIGAVKDVKENVQLPAWAPAGSKVKYATLVSSASGPSLVEKWGLTSQVDKWSTWMAAPNPEDSLAKSSYPLMEQLLLVNTFRPDRMSVLCLNAILSRLEIDSLVPNTPLEETIVGSAARTPILLVATGGADPSMEVQEVAMLRVGKQRFTQIALGGGQTDEAMQQVRRCAAQGEWLFLKNLHLVLDWAATLEKELCAMPEPNRDFRLIITTEPHDAFPSVLLRMSLKVTVEAPPGVKQNLLRTYSAWDRAFLEAQSDTGAPMLFALAWLHAIAQERRNFVPQGWVKFYEFSPADLKAATSIITAQSRKQAQQGSAPGGKTPATDWVTIKGFLETCIYGGRLDNTHDEETLSQLINGYFSEDVVQRGKVPLFADVTVPTSNNHDAVVAFLQKSLPDVDPPSLLKLPDNADRAVHEAVATEQMELLRSLSQEMQAAHVSSTEGWRALLAPVLELWKSAGLAGAAAGPMRAIAQGNKDPDPMEVFFVSEVNMLIRLIGDLTAFFDSLSALSEGALIPSESLRAEASELSTGRMPASWLDRMSGPKEAKLWLALLSRKYTSTTAMLKSPNVTASTVYDLTNLLRPETFFNALRQHTARQCKSPLVDLVLVATVGGANSVPASLQVSVTVAGSSLCLQGASMGANGQLSRLSAHAPSSTPLTTNVVVRWVPGAELAEQTRRSAGKSTTIPVYASADRTVQLFPLTVPCANEQEATLLNMNGVACYLMVS